MRKLASIQKIEEIISIEGASNVELAKVLGWYTIVKIGQFKPKDLCVFFEIDSILPERPEFEFLRQRKFRVRTMKSNRLGVISQGLAMQLNEVLPKEDLADITTYNRHDKIIGMDVTELLGVQKYEIPIEGGKNTKPKGAFPIYICPKTDELRIQAFPKLLKEMQGLPYVARIKYDGCLSYHTTINTDHGDLPIGLIVNKKLPVRVLSYNEECKKIEYKPISCYHKTKRAEPFISLKVERSRLDKGKYKEIVCTKDHKFLSDGIWKRADELKKEDYISHMYVEVPIEVKEVIMGTLLGDSCINFHNGKVKSIGFVQGECHNEYFEYMKSIMGKWFNECVGNRGGYSGSKLNRRGNTKVTRDISELILSNCVVDEKKMVTKEWLNFLTPLSIAIWYQDAGTISNRLGIKQKPRAIFNTQSFSMEEMILLKNMFYEKFGITSYITNCKGYILILNPESTIKLFNIIYPFVCKSMRYKLSPEYENKEFHIFEIPIENYKLYNIKILNVSECVPRKFDSSYFKYQYDLTVDNNHTYFAKGLLTHNTSFTCYSFNGESGICSRNLELHETDSDVYWKVARIYNLPQRLVEYCKLIGKNYAIQGEICGPIVIHGGRNPLNARTDDLHVFSIYDIDTHMYLNDVAAESVAKDLGLKFVALYEEGDNFNYTIEELESKTKGVCYPGTENQVEGLVFRPKKSMHSATIGAQLSFKIIDKEYLLEE